MLYCALYIHMITTLYEIVFAENDADNCKATGWDDPLVGKLNFYRLMMTVTIVFLWNIVSENITKWVILFI